MSKAENREQELKACEEQLGVNQQVEELMERVRLTPGDIKTVLDNLKLLPPIWSSDKNCWVDGEFEQRHRAVAKAQLDKVLNDPDLALIDRGKDGQAWIVIPLTLETKK